MPWHSSEDKYVGTLDQPRDRLKEVIKEDRASWPSAIQAEGHCHSVEALESKEQLVAACPGPQLKRKTLKASLCSDKTKRSPEQIAAAGQRRREELEMRGEIDSVADRQPYPTAHV